MRLLSDASRITYPFDLAPGTMCSDAFDCQRIAHMLAEGGETGHVRVHGVLFEENRGPWDVINRVELPNLQHMQPGSLGCHHRSGPFVFDVDKLR